MRGWLTDRLLALRTWLLVRLGLWRGQWRRGRVTVAAAPFAAWPFGGQTWRYGLYAPAGLPDDETAPLIVLLHGCRQRALGFAHASGLTQLADRTRARLLCPQQARLVNPLSCWSWFSPLAQSGAGELRVVVAAIDDAAKLVRIGTDSIAAVGISAGGALAALLAFHAPERFRGVIAVAAPPLLGSFNVQDPRDVMRRGLALAPALALGLTRRACAPLAIVQGGADQVVHPACAEQLQEQALESLRRAGTAVSARTMTGPATGAVVDYRHGDFVRLRRIDLPGLGHEWTGGPGGHPYCRRGGPPLTQICSDFLRDAGVLGRTASR